MYSWRHRPLGVEIHYDVNHIGNALVQLPTTLPEPVKRSHGSWEIKIPSNALASFGWNAGVAESMDIVRRLRRTPDSDEDKAHNAVIAHVMEELDRMRRIGR